MCRFSNRGIFFGVVAVAAALVAIPESLVLYRVSASSMEPTLHDGDVLLAMRSESVLSHIINRTWGLRRRGDLAVIRPPGESSLAIKRIVGLAGDRVRIQGGALLVNGRRLQEPWRMSVQLSDWPSGGDSDVEVPSRCYFLLGDNRDHSLDSRVWGMLPEDRVVGSVVGVLAANAVQADAVASGSN